MKNFLINIVKEGQFYVARCPALDITSQGNSIEKAERNIREAIEAYLAAFGSESRDQAETEGSVPYWTMVAI